MPCSRVFLCWYLLAGCFLCGTAVTNHRWFHPLSARAGLGGVRTFWTSSSSPWTGFADVFRSRGCTLGGTTGVTWLSWMRAPFRRWFCDLDRCCLDLGTVGSCSCSQSFPDIWKPILEWTLRHSHVYASLSSDFPPSFSVGTHELVQILCFFEAKETLHCLILIDFWWEPTCLRKDLTISRSCFSRGRVEVLRTKLGATSCLRGLVTLTRLRPVAVLRSFWHSLMRAAAWLAWEILGRSLPRRWFDIGFRTLQGWLSAVRTSTRTDSVTVV